MNDNPLLAGALHALSLGLHPIPVGRDKKPLIAWKPYQSRPPTEAEVRRWWSQWPDARLAILTGTDGGVDVVDFDPGCDPTWPGPDRELPIACIVKTPRGGRHYYCRHTPGVRNSASKLGKGVDVRGEGGYVLVPPSPGYAVQIGGLAEALACAPPAWLRDALLAASRNRENVRTPAQTGDPNAGDIVEGRRNVALTSLAGALRRRGAETDEIEAAVQKHNLAHCKPPLDAAEVRKIAVSVAQYPPAAPPTQRLSTGDNSVARLMTDVGLAARLVERHGEDIRFCPQWGRWIVWDGTRWNPDNDLAVERLAKETGLSIFDEARDAHDSKLQEKLAKFAIASQRRERITAMISLSRCEVVVAPDELDADPFALNLLNGTLDLKTGELRPHRREDLCTKLAPVQYDAAATCPRWAKFLERVMPVAALRDYLQRLAGLCLTADAREQVLPIFYGVGDNGKNVFLDTMTGLLGNYASEAPPDLLVVRRSEEHPTEIADLCGKRLIAASETEEGIRLRTALIKRLTGNARLKGRFMRQDYFEFSRTFKLILATNTKPRVHEETHAIWRRLKLIPFTVRVPEAEQDKELTQKLVAEWPGILCWALVGCLDWQREGLVTPDAVERATIEYREEEDILRDFYDSCCVFDEFDPDCWVSRAALYDVYLRWADMRGNHNPLSKGSLFERVRRLAGVEEKQRGSRGQQERGFCGIGV